MTATSDSSRLAVTTEPPTTIVAGVGFGLTIAVENAGGQVDSTYNGLVTLLLATNPGGSTLGGTLTVNASSGLATFTGLTLNKAVAGYTIAATATGRTSATSSPVTVSAAQATHLVVTTQPPSELAVGQTAGIAVAAEDPYGNVDTNFDGQFTITLAANPGGASWQSSGNAANGVITTNLTLYQSGNGYVVLFTCINNGWTVTTNPVNVAGALTIPSIPPTIIGERILTAGKGKHKHVVDSS